MTGASAPLVRGVARSAHRAGGSRALIAGAGSAARNEPGTPVRRGPGVLALPIAADPAAASIRARVSRRRRRIRRASASCPILRMPGMGPAMLASLTVLVALDILVVYLPALGEERGMTPATVGALLACRAGASMGPGCCWVG